MIFYSPIFNFQFSIFNLQFSIFNLQSSIFNFQFSIFQSSIFNFLLPLQLLQRLHAPYEEGNDDQRYYLRHVFLHHFARIRRV